MPALLSHGNTNVSKIWFLLLIFVIVLVIVLIDTRQTVKEIEASVGERYSLVEINL